MSNQTETTLQDDVFMLLENITGHRNLITIPTAFIKFTGSMKTALLLSQMIYWTGKSSADDGWFWKTHTQWKEEIFLSEDDVRKSRNKLEKLGFIETDLRKVNGAPTNHYRVKKRELTIALLDFFRMETEKTPDSNPENFQIPIRKNSRKQSGETPVSSIQTLPTDITSDITSKDNVHSTPEGKEIEQPPEQVIPNLTVDDTITEVIEYLNLKTNGSFRAKTKEHRKNISARLSDGYTLDDIKMVIDNKASEWMGTDMEKNLTPSTLFRPGNFDRYLSNAKRDQQKAAQGQGGRHTPAGMTKPASGKVGWQRRSR